MLSVRHKVQVKHVFDAGGLIAYPTEAVFGIGCDPFNSAAVYRLLEIKQRDWRKGLILLADSFSTVLKVTQPLNEANWDLLSISWPGPFTFLIPANEIIPEWVRGEPPPGMPPKVAIRIPSHPIARSVCETVGGLIISTSLNITGQPPVRDVFQAKKQWQHLVDYIVPGEVGGQKNPTQIRDLISGECIRAS